jgi:hypothetical protein
MILLCKIILNQGVISIENNQILDFSSIDIVEANDNDLMGESTS